MSSRPLSSWCVVLVVAFSVSGGAQGRLAAQLPGGISGTVTAATATTPLERALVTVVGLNRTAFTTADGRYALHPLPAGRYAVRFQRLGYAPALREVDVSDSIRLQLDVALTPIALQLEAIQVEGVSRRTQAMLDAPAAVSVSSPQTALAAGTTGQLPQVFAHMPGVDMPQSGGNDFKVNTRGFNSPLARTVLVLQDGRDLAMPFLGMQDWAAIAVPADEMAAVEFVRGPGSALYGPNALVGTINLVTPRARDLTGTRISLSGGELSTLRGALRHAGVLFGGRAGYRLDVSHLRSGNWTRSRTRLDRQDVATEYAGVTDSAGTPLGPERDPLRGQARDPVTGAVSGDPDDVMATTGSARFDWYARGGGVGTLDGGLARLQNDVLLTGAGRVQVVQALRPWARIAWSDPHFHLNAWYSGRQSKRASFLNTGAPSQDHSAFFQIELQYRTAMLKERLQLVTGTSLRDTRVNTFGTLFDAANDDRSDLSYGMFGQGEYAVSRRVALVAAVRWDRGDLFEAQVSPKGGLVVRLSDQHSVRATVNHAFLTPTQTERFLRLPLGSARYDTLEARLRTVLATELAGVPGGTLFGNGGAVPVLAMGNPDLVPQMVTSIEMGYKGQPLRRWLVTVDLYFNRKRQFVTALLPAIIANPAFQPWTAPGSVPAASRALVEAAVRAALPPGTPLTRLPDGSTAIVQSVGNVGLVHEWGVEGGVTGSLADPWTVSVSYAYYGFRIAEQLPLDPLQPNTPRHRGTVGLGYAGRGLEAQVSARVVDGFRWSSGLYRGYVPASATVDITAEYRLTAHARANLVGSNVLNHRHFQIYGGSVIGRRILGGMTVTF